MSTTPKTPTTAHVSTLELFFDLVFVFTITQVTERVLAAHSWTDYSRALLIFAVTWWMYGGYAWLTNNVGTNGTVPRLLLLGGMVGFLMMALSVPHAFERDGVAFGLGYLLVVGLHAALFTRAPGGSVRAVASIALFNSVAALLVLAAALAPAGWKLSLWALAALVLVVSSVLRSGHNITVSPSHFAERHGLVIIVALGESIVSIGVGVGDEPVLGALVVAAVLGLMLTAGLWWSYFDRDSAGAEGALSHLAGERRAAVAVNAYLYAHLVMLFGIVLVAAGVHGVIVHLHEAVSPPTAWWLGVGSALYLVGDALFRRSTGIGRGRSRLLTALIALGSVGLGLWLGGLIQLAALAALLAGMLVVEARAGWR